MPVKHYSEAEEKVLVYTLANMLAGDNKALLAEFLANPQVLIQYEECMLYDSTGNVSYPNRIGISALKAPVQILNKEPAFVDLTPKKFYHWIQDTFKTRFAERISTADKNVMREEISKRLAMDLPLNAEFQRELKGRLSKQYYRTRFTVLFNNIKVNCTRSIRANKTYDENDDMWPQDLSFASYLDSPFRTVKDTPFKQNSIVSQFETRPSTDSIDATGYTFSPDFLPNQLPFSTEVSILPRPRKGSCCEMDMPYTPRMSVHTISRDATPRLRSMDCEPDMESKKNLLSFFESLNTDCKS